MNRSEERYPEIRARPGSPFDDSAEERQRRMGLLTDFGQPNEEAVTMLSRICAGQYYDDLWDFCQDADTAAGSIRQFLESAKQADPKRRFLLICLQYDAIFQTLPNPVWWISGNPVLAALFSEGFVDRLRELMKETGA